MTRKQLFLHIGRPKVGSTALQNFLWQNRDALLERGVLYPRSVMHQRGSHKLALAFQPGLAEHHVVAHLSAQDVYDEMHAEAETSGATTILASSENLFLLDPKEPARHLIGRYDTRIVCYVRRQDEVLVSSFLQEVKSGAVDPNCDIDAYARSPERLQLLDYAAVLGHWEREFGRDNIIVRPFEPAQMAGTIFEDFLSIAGIDPAGLTMPTTRMNPSPARDVLEYMRMINEVPESGRVVKGRLHSTLLNASEAMGHAGAFDAKSMIPARVRREILERFAESNAAVANRYLGGGDGILFRDTAIADDSGKTPYTGLDLERFARMTAALFCTQQQKIEALQKQLVAIRRQIAEAGEQDV